jgi:hypothetical protein
VVAYQFERNVESDQIMRLERLISSLLVVELILHGAHQGIVSCTRKLCFVSATCVQAVIFSKYLP